jgi:hypothetical protein
MEKVLAKPAVITIVTEQLLGLLGCLLRLFTHRVELYHLVQTLAQGIYRGVPWLQRILVAIIFLMVPQVGLLYQVSLMLKLPIVSQLHDLS